MTTDVASEPTQVTMCGRRGAIEVTNLIVTYGSGRHSFRAVDDVSLTVEPGESVGLVGESGSGKSTVAKAVMGLVRPERGSIDVDGVSPIGLDDGGLREYWQHVQMVFQDPISSLNPRRSVADSVRLPLDRHHRGTQVDRRERVAELLELVGLDVGHHGDKRPGELSGGQCQRVAIARALALEPRVLLCDEAVSALDVSVQAQILNLLNDLRERLGLTMLFISHDLAVVRAVSDRVAVMYRGRTCEHAHVDDVFEQRAHPYTDLLIRSIPGEGTAVDMSDEADGENHPDGCVFSDRCPRVSPSCAVTPPLVELDDAPGHRVACWHPLR